MHWLDENRCRRVGDIPFMKLLQGQVTKEPGDSIDTGKNRYMLNSFNGVRQKLVNAGLSPDIATFAAAQSAFETNGWKSNVFKQNNNLSGITWINKPYQKATKGTKKPEGGYYAHYANMNDWANDFKRVISIGGAGAAIHATDLQDYVDRLYKNHYFTSSPGPYYTALKTILQVAGDMQSQQTKQLDAAKEKEKNKGKNKGKGPNWFKQHPIWTGVIVAATAVVVIRSVNN